MMNMTLDEYQALADRTANHANDKKKIEDVPYPVLEAALGMAGEAGEICDMLKKHFFQGHDLDLEHLLKEAGDVLWYVARIATGLGYTLNEVGKRNIDKLEARYHGSFSAESSIHRREGDV